MLLDRLEELLAGATPSALDETLRRVVRAQDQRDAGLQRANASRRANPPVQQLVRRAADQYLTPALRAALDREQWAPSLHGWLGRRYRDVGLEQQPCIETVEAALGGWEPKSHKAIPALRDTVRAST